MSMPDIDLFHGLAADLPFSPQEGTTFDWSVWADIEFSCVALAISKKLSTGATALEVTGAGLGVLVHLVGADLPSTKAPGPYDYQFRVKVGTEWRDVAGVGTIYLSRQV